MAVRPGTLVRETATSDPDVRLCLGVPVAHAVRTDVGRIRSNNEDSFGTTWLPDGSLLVVVADGMGGHEAGEVASRLAVEVVGEVVARSPASEPQQAIYDALLAANRAILDEGRQAGRRGMGTTAVVAWIRGDEVQVGLVGDSRLYQIRQGRVVERTVDHTRVQSLLDKGTISAAEAREHPESGMLTRALGHARMSNGKALEPEVFAEPLRLQPGDALVLSTDGLHDLAEDWEIATSIAGERPDAAADALVELALDRGGHDNVTVAVVVHGSRADPAVATSSEEDEDEDEATVPVARSASDAVVAARGGGNDRMLLFAAIGGALLLLLSVTILLLAVSMALW